MSLEIEIAGNDLLTKQQNELIKTVIKEVLSEEGVPFNVEVSITITSNAEIRVMNKTHRDVDSATDVLSFPMYECDEILNFDNTNEILLGDIVISIERAKEQAKDFNHSLDREIAFLTAHGMFHLLGYDHMEKEEENIMFAKQKVVLQSLGINR